MLLILIVITFDKFFIQGLQIGNRKSILQKSLLKQS